MGEGEGGCLLVVEVGQAERFPLLGGPVVGASQTAREVLADLSTDRNDWEAYS
ncbi:hypothetical protein ACFYVE_23760 [Streptomyces tendae]|uniref:hypothetical protein n=1 Tax=Streptomyces tendae TaxID=1932 RepID=UPI00367C6430